jgi:hypothetical protein
MMALSSAALHFLWSAMAIGRRRDVALETDSRQQPGPRAIREKLRQAD